MQGFLKFPSFFTSKGRSFSTFSLISRIFDEMLPHWIVMVGGLVLFLLGASSLSLSLLLDLSCLVSLSRLFRKKSSSSLLAWIWRASPVSSGVLLGIQK